MNKMNTQEKFNKIQLYMMDTPEKEVDIVCELNEGFGLSTNEMPRIRRLRYDTVHGEGWLDFTFEGSDEWNQLEDDDEEMVNIIYNYIRDDH